MQNLRLHHSLSRAWFYNLFRTDHYYHHAHCCVNLSVCMLSTVLVVHFVCMALSFWGGCNPLKPPPPLDLPLTLSVDKEEVLSPSGWLSDTVIEVAQRLILQEFPVISSLQDPAVHQSLSFQVLRGDFAQIIIVGGCHWCTVSNIGCDDGVVNVYNTMYSSVSSATLKLIASLVFSPANQLVVRMMDVGRQSNCSDCGILAIAFAYDICGGNDPCPVKFDHRSIRQHLANCLEQCRLSRFPIACE